MLKNALKLQNYFKNPSKNMSPGCGNWLKWLHWTHTSHLEVDEHPYKGVQSLKASNITH